MYRGNNVDGLTETGKRHWPPKVNHLVEKKVENESSRRRRSSRRERESSSRRERDSSKRERKQSSTITSSRNSSNVNTQNRADIGGCAGTRLGCCKDQHGNNMNIQKRNEEGTNCPQFNECAGTQYGCCKDADGNNTNIAAYADGKNCPPLPCGRFGCCPDSVTPRNDSTGSNCPLDECQTSKHGCCFDNKTARTDAQGTNCETDSGGGLSNICNNPTDDVDVEFESLNGQTKQGKCFLLRDENGEQTLVCTFNNFCGED